MLSQTQSRATTSATTLPPKSEQEMPTVAKIWYITDPTDQ